MAITFTLLYVYFCPLFQDSVICASFGFSLEALMASKTLAGLSFRSPIDLRRINRSNNKYMLL